MLTADQLEPYVGGHLEVTNPQENYRYRGKIKSATINGDDLRIELHWNLKLEGGWQADDSILYCAALSIFNGPSFMPAGGECYGDPDRLVLISPVTHELMAFHHPSGQSVQRFEESNVNAHV